MDRRHFCLLSYTAMKRRCKYIILLEATNIKYDVEDRLLIDVEHLQIQQNDRIGLVGRNGSGKTTLLELLAGIIEPHDGGVIVSHASSELLPQLKNTQTT